MKTFQAKWDQSNGWSSDPEPGLANEAQLVLAFGSREVLEDAERFEEMRRQFPKAHIASCTTSGEIFGTHIYDNTVSCTAFHFGKTAVSAVSVNAQDYSCTAEAGKALASQLKQEGLKHVFVLSDGQLVNGSDLVVGMSDVFPPHVHVTGGLAGDADRFTKTLVGLDAPPASGTLVAVGLYGDSIRVGFGSRGGWDAFGPIRVVTRAEANVLYELDGQPALDLYKKYLGEQASELPGSGLLFPIAMLQEGSEEPIVRTLLSVDENEQSMTFAGNIPVGQKVQLMRANFDRLIDGAMAAANECCSRVGPDTPSAAILVSCVGRRLILGARTEEEVEEVQQCLGDQTTLTGFYSYGEICPSFTKKREDLPCSSLHNQTMTVTTLAEV